MYNGMRYKVSHMACHDTFDSEINMIALGEIECDFCLQYMLLSWLHSYTIYVDDACVRIHEKKNGYRRVHRFQFQCARGERCVFFFLFTQVMLICYSFI